MSTNDSSTSGPGAPSKALRAELLPLLLAILSVATLETAQFEAGGARWQIAAKVGLIAVVVAAIYRLFSRWGSAGLEPGRLTGGLLVGLALLPIPVEALQRTVWHTGSPLELLLLAGFRNVVCGLAVVSYRRGYDRICCVVSMFIMIFASAITSDPLVHGLVIVFALCGVWWLMGIYWDSLQGHLVGSKRRQFPRRLLISIPLLFVAFMGVLPLAAPQVTAALPGWMPSSGGDQWADPFARSGVNDGEALVPATENARSFGPVETDIFLESTQPSLYDVFNEMYGTPPKNLKMDRAIALPPEYLKHAHERMANQKKLGKQFSTVRRSRPQKTTAQKDVNGTAMLYVGGRTPLHLRLEVFDLFDGVQWFPEELTDIPSQLKLRMIGKQPWIRLPQPDAEEVLARPEAHQLKIINLKTNRIPSPPGLVGIHIDKVDRADMFEWAQESIVKMDREELPDLTVIHLQSQTAIRERLLATTIRKSSGQVHHRQLPEIPSAAQLSELANSWAGTATNDWQRIEAVIAKLRATQTLDREYRTPETCQDPVGEFLFESHRGTDYMFATAAALLLRSMGYSTRIVSGFYVDPAKFEAKSRHTPVNREDVHFWLEIYTSPGTWITLEPTPGYAVLLPPLSFWQSCLLAASQALEHLYANAWAYLAAVLVSLSGWRYRAELCDQLATMWWRIFPARQHRQQVLQTVLLLEQRSRWVGMGRKPTDTASTWLLALAVKHGSTDRDLVRRFSLASDWASYAPEHHTSSPVPGIPDICHDIVNHWTLAHLKKLRTHLAGPRPSS